MTLYRGYEVEQTANGYRWVDDDGAEHNGYDREDDALDAIDTYKRQRANAANS